MSRRILQVLQPSASNQMVLVGSSGMIKLDSQKEAIKKKPAKTGKGIIDENRLVQVESIQGTSKSCINQRQHPTLYANKETQTDLGTDATTFKQLTLKDAPLNYWKEIAEKRRLALEEALEENKKLHEEIEVLEHDNKELREISKQAESLALLLESLTSDSSESSEPSVTEEFKK